MEPVTHFLFGAAMGRAGLNRKTALATATLTLAAEAPDLDVLSRFGGSAFFFGRAACGGGGGRVYLSCLATARP
ncbi:MAG: hypothetical protein ABR908_12230 [Terriglobales bacterium]